ncbi:MAG TPA: DUF3040 domain-containing protein [Actinophytocola sp.]|nr:DUF3040 domain-containing protein [Actinophytocola sp.]
MPLSPYEQRVLAVIENELGQDDPTLAASLRRGRPPSPIRREVPFWAGQLWVLTLALGALALHPLVLHLGVVGVGLLTGALVLPWLLNAARSARAQASLADGATDHDRSR